MHFQMIALCRLRCLYTISCKAGTYSAFTGAAVSCIRSLFRNGWKDDLLDVLDRAISRIACAVPRAVSGVWRLGINPFSAPPCRTFWESGTSDSQASHVPRLQPPMSKALYVQVAR